MAGTPGSERTIGQLVADATHDFQGLVRSEIALAKAEVTSGAKDVGKGAGLLAAAAFFGLMGLVFLLHEALPIWAGYLIVAVVVLVLAAILGLLGKKSLETAKPAPDRAIDQAQQTIAALKKTTDAA